MKKTENDVLTLYVNALQGMTIAASMMTLAMLCNEVKEDWPEFEKLLYIYQEFDKLNRKDCHNKYNPSDKTLNTGKTFLQEIKNFKFHPDVQNQDIQEIIDNTIETTQLLLS